MLYASNQFSSSQLRRHSVAEKLALRGLSFRTKPLSGLATAARCTWLATNSILSVQLCGFHEKAICQYVEHPHRPMQPTDFSLMQVFQLNPHASIIFISVKRSATTVLLRGCCTPGPAAQRNSSEGPRSLALNTSLLISFSSLFTLTSSSGSSEAVGAWTHYYACSILAQTV